MRDQRWLHDGGLGGPSSTGRASREGSGVLGARQGAECQERRAVNMGRRDFENIPLCDDDWLHPAFGLVHAFDDVRPEFVFGRFHKAFTFCRVEVQQCRVSGTDFVGVFTVGLEYLRNGFELLVSGSSPSPEGVVIMY
jgi:hypothetical protein